MWQTSINSEKYQATRSTGIFGAIHTGLACIEQRPALCSTMLPRVKHPEGVIIIHRVDKNLLHQVNLTPYN